jgi:predicted Zn-dependent protease
MKGACGYDPYADSAFLASRRAPSRFKSMIELGEDSTGIIEEGAPGIG